MKIRNTNLSRRQFIAKSGFAGAGLVAAKLAGLSTLSGIMVSCGGDGNDDTGSTGCSVTGEPDFLSKWGANGGDGTSGSGDGEFNRPLGIALDSAGNVYVADVNNDRVQKFDEAGNFLLAWGSSGTGDGQFNKPSGIAIDSADNVYVAENDNGGRRIQKFDSNGTYITQWDGSAGAGGSFSGPNAIAIDADDNIYAADTWNDQIQKFDSDGNYITHFGGSGSGDGQFDTTKGVAVDSNGNVYAASGDGGQDRIMKFTSDGTFLGWWGADDLGGTGWHAPGSGRTASNGTGDGEFDIPKGVSVDKNNNVYVCENNRVQKFTADGVLLGWWGRDDMGLTGWHAPGSGLFSASGSGDGEFSNPRDIVISPKNCKIYVTDAGNNRIQVFS